MESIKEGSLLFLQDFLMQNKSLSLKLKRETQYT